LAEIQKIRGNRKLRLASESITRYLSNARPTRGRCGAFQAICSLRRFPTGSVTWLAARMNLSRCLHTWHSGATSVVKGATNSRLSTFGDCPPFIRGVLRGVSQNEKREIITSTQAIRESPLSTNCPVVASPRVVTRRKAYPDHAVIRPKQLSRER
jgi:hypothetical protein